MKAWPLVIFSLSAGVGGAAIAIPTEIVIEKNKPQPVIPYVDNVITCESKHSKIEFSCSVEKLSEKDDFVNIPLTIKNNWTKKLTDASITLVVRNTDAITIAIGSIDAGGQKVIYKTRNELNNLLQMNGYKAISTGDKINFMLVRTGSYTIQNNRLMVADKFNNYSYVSDSELSKLSSKFLVYDSANETYELQSGFTDWAFSQTTTNNIYLIGGEYQMNGASGGTFNINGLLNSKGAKLATFKLYYGDDISPGAIHPFQVNAAFTFNKVNILARVAYSCSYYVNGFFPTSTKFENCDFKGSYTVYNQDVEFTNCTFDNRECIDDTEGNWKCRDALFFYSNSSGVLNNCTFTTSGKCLKFYTEGNAVSANPSKVNNCTFKYDQDFINKWKEEHGGVNAPEIKVPVEIDSRIITQSDLYIKIKIDSPKLEGYPASREHKELWHDDRGPTADGIYSDKSDKSSPYGRDITVTNYHITNNQ